MTFLCLGKRHNLFPL